MTTPADPWITILPQIKDKASLQLMGRLVEAQVTVLESQVQQLKQVRTLIDEQIKNIR
jgi:lipopolysaccharide biosynthesis regulator YciM